MLTLVSRITDSPCFSTVKLLKLNPVLSINFCSFPPVNLMVALDDVNVPLLIISPAIENIPLLWVKEAPVSTSIVLTDEDVLTIGIRAALTGINASIANDGKYPHAQLPKLSHAVDTSPDHILLPTDTAITLLVSLHPLFVVPTTYISSLCCKLVVAYDVDSEL